MIKKLEKREVSLPNNPATVKWVGMDNESLFNKINELVDAVNKYEDIIRQIGEWGSSKGECLWCETLTKFEPNGLKGKQ